MPWPSMPCARFSGPQRGQSVVLHLVGAPFEGAGVSYRREPSMPKLARFRAKHNATGSAPVAAPAAHVSSTSFDSSCSILHVDMDAFFVSVELLAHPRSEEHTSELQSLAY